MTDFDTKNLTGEAKKIAVLINSIMLEGSTNGGCKAYYSPTEWKNRNESYGLESVLILVHDGGDLATYCNIDYSCATRIERLRKVLEDNGYYIENCTGWYSAVYRIYSSSLANSLYYSENS